MGLMHSKVEKAGSGTAGFGIGVTDEVDPDVKSACYFGKGTNAGISMKGFIFIGKESKPLPPDFNYDKFHLSFQCSRNNNATEMALVCKAPGVHDTELIYKTSHDVTGLVTLTNKDRKSKRLNSSHK